MIIKKIIIAGKSDETVLSITLKDILYCIDNPSSYKWNLLWIEGIGTYEDSILDFEAKINELNNGIQFEFDELIKLSDSMHQILELTLIADLKVEKLIRYETDTQMYKNCKYVIELIDSCFWEFTSSDINTIEIIKQKFDGVFDVENVNFLSL
ncbi:hypothetical protein GKZ90_0025545 [Flavobacterium sp. MC2016-06]|jgi:hypothetical protein|uniref:hypothetical protein n=1 Tax=Flavobacterium sp. MC2016-06 TaxID=2676308 RepID=UPI0012BABCC3|nr:hypothetical protein [Flavobacterium sp. MC2016-06]MBU3862490.1 hypothetical protein [Flavobacterium sp. MC2016-06]